MIPTDPVILLSYVNTKLRVNYRSLAEFCEDKEVKQEDIEEKLRAIDYTYDPALNKFV